jgi:hypothetical protein
MLIAAAHPNSKKIAKRYLYPIIFASFKNIKNGHVIIFSDLSLLVTIGRNYGLISFSHSTRRHDWISCAAALVLAIGSRNTIRVTGVPASA